MNTMSEANLSCADSYVACLRTVDRGHRPTSGCAVVCAGAKARLWSASGSAEHELGSTVIVTAQKREESAKDVPLTMVVFDGATLEQSRVFTDLNDYAKFVPGLIYNSPGNGERLRSPDIAIRGVANSRLGDFETNIGTATTGLRVLATCRPMPSATELIDIQRIEVLEGPQGTLYGAAAMGGLIQVVPNLPDFTGFLRQGPEPGYPLLIPAGAPATTAINVSAFVNIPLSDIFAFRASRSIPAQTRAPHRCPYDDRQHPHDQYGPNGLVAFNSLSSNTYGAGGEFLTERQSEHLRRRQDGVALQAQRAVRCDAGLHV